MALEEYSAHKLRATFMELFCHYLSLSVSSCSSFVKEKLWHCTSFGKKIIQVLDETVSLFVWIVHCSSTWRKALVKCFTSLQISDQKLFTSIYLSHSAAEDVPSHSHPHERSGWSYTLQCLLWLSVVFNANTLCMFVWFLHTHKQLWTNKHPC